jgi:hypothetical protein
MKMKSVLALLFAASLSFGSVSAAIAADDMPLADARVAEERLLGSADHLLVVRLRLVKANSTTSASGESRNTTKSPPIARQTMLVSSLIAAATAST